MDSRLPHKREKAQVGIGTLIVFIAMVLVAAIAAGVLINTAGFLQSQSEQTGQESSSQVSDRLQVVGTVGDHVVDVESDGVNEVTVVNMTVKKAPGANDIDLESVTAQFITEGQVVDLIHNDSEQAALDDDKTGKVYDIDTWGTTFNTTTIQDQNDDSIRNSNVLNDAADRARITFNLDEDIKPYTLTSGNDGEGWGFNSNAATHDIDALEEGQQATIQLNTQAGGETTVTITIPDSLSSKTSVQL